MCPKGDQQGPLALLCLVLETALTHSQCFHWELNGGFPPVWPVNSALCLWVVVPELGAPMARRGCSQNPGPLTINPCLDLHLPHSLI